MSEDTLGDPSCKNCHGKGYKNFGRHEFPGPHSRPAKAVLCECAANRIAAGLKGLALEGNPKLSAPHRTDSA